jgi:hypothetical protein
MTKHAQVAAMHSVNAGMKMSSVARARMCLLERDAFKYYDDIGAGKDNCTWGPASLPIEALVLERNWRGRSAQQWSRLSSPAGS